MAFAPEIDDSAQEAKKQQRDKAFADLERERTGMVFEPTEHRRDPYSHYAVLRDRDPVHHHPRLDGFVLTRHEDCLAALRDPRFTSDNRELRVFASLKAQLVQDGGDPKAIEQPGMMGIDGPAHSRLRGLVSKGFTPRAIAALVPRIEGIVSELLEPLRPGEAFEWMRAVAHPLPSIVIAEMLGVPKEDRSHFHRWSGELLQGGALEIPARRRRGIKAGEALATYFVDMIKRRRADPGPDILSALICVVDEEGDRLNTRELISSCILLLLAGHAGTSAMLGNGLLSLLQHPAQLAQLRADPTLWASAVEEMLRFEGAVQSMLRVAREDLRIHGKPVKKGQTALLVVAAANRDPEVFHAPNTFDIRRHPNDHLALGRGQHFCLGASLARLEMKIALKALFDRFPELELVGKHPEDVRWREGGLRSLVELSVCAESARRGGLRNS